MEILERIWELLQLVFGSFLRSFERAITSMFGSSNARFLKRLQGRVAEINAIESKISADDRRTVSGSDGFISRAVTTR